ncbi:MAG: hypothetical protein QOJ82_1431 [Solirubrobacteraceae bacterium]|nr:hypothetical protein [Solirubrobacteraceae bacterium]
MTRTRRLTMVAVAVALVVVGYVVLRDGGSSARHAGAGSFATIDLVHGRPRGGVRTVTVAKGDQVRLKVKSDVADEIHVHGYELHRDVRPGRAVQLTFQASIDGQFVVELENAKQQIATLRVNP